jgi:hypothetical protein
MDTKSQELFDKIISMDQETLTDEQKGFLMARRDYMNDEQRKRYADMIELHEKGELFTVPLEKMSVAQLKAEAKKRKVSITGLKTAEEILSAIEEAEQE